MVTIRLARGGATKRPFYSIVVADRRRATASGSWIERLGFFNPLAAQHEEKLRVDLERYQYWLARGARPSERVADLVAQQARSAG